MQLWDAAFQAFSKGIIADKNEKLEFNETEISIHSPDLYRFIRKYYKNIWAYYICFFRIITLHNPIKELLSIYLTRKVERVNIFEKFYAYPDYLNFKSKRHYIYPYTYPCKTWLSILKPIQECF